MKVMRPNGHASCSGGRGELNDFDQLATPGVEIQATLLRRARRNAAMASACIILNSPYRCPRFRIATTTWRLRLDGQAV